MTRGVTVDQLPESTLPEAGGLGAGVLLYCWKCGGEYSATRGDYWALEGDQDKPLRCDVGHRPINLQLVRRVVSMVPA